MGFSLEQFQVFFLVLVRVSTMLFLLPVFGYHGVPPQLKIGLSLALSLVLSPVVKASPMPLGLSLFVVMIGKEVLAGALIGFLAFLIFWGVQTAGGVAGFQMGFGIARVFDPQLQTQVPLVSQFQYLLALMIFLLINGHHVLLQGLSKSFDLIPLLGVGFSSPIGTELIKMTGQVFEVAVKISAPVIVTLLLTDIGLGILARTLPQMNIFIVGFPVKIGMGLIALFLSLPLFAYVLGRLFSDLEGNLALILRLLHAR